MGSRSYSWDLPTWRGAQVGAVCRGCPSGPRVIFASSGCVAPVVSGFCPCGSQTARSCSPSPGRLLFNRHQTLAEDSILSELWQKRMIEQTHSWGSIHAGCSSLCGSSFLPYSPNAFRVFLSVNMCIESSLIIRQVRNILTDTR